MNSVQIPSRENTHIKAQNIIVFLLAVLTIFLGSAGIVCWHTNNIRFIQVAPSFVPMQYNSALLFVLSGTALLSLLHGHRHIVITCAVITGCIAILTLMETVLGKNFGIDELFAKGYVTDKFSNAGRMAPNTAICFILTVIAVVVGQIPSNKERPILLSVVGSMILAVAIATLLAYLAHIENVYGWGGVITPMAVHTAFGFLALGIGLVLFPWPGGNPYIPLVVTVILGVTISFFSFGISRDLANQSAKAEFKSKVKEWISVFNEQIRTSLEDIEATRVFYTASNEIERNELMVFMKTFTDSHKNIQALQWIPRVKESERKLYEDTLKGEGFSNFEFREQNRNGDLVSASTHNEYFPIYLITPYEGNEAALGFDFGSNPDRLEAIQTARDSGHEVTTASLRLVQGSGDKLGFSILSPVYKKNKLEDSVSWRRENLLGFVSGAFRIDSVIKETLKRYKLPGARIYLFDKSAPVERQFVYEYPPKSAVEPERKISENDLSKAFPLLDKEELDIAGRKWSLVVAAGKESKSISHDWFPWSALLIGLLLTFLISLYFASLIGRTKAIEIEVANQTEKLMRTYQSLRESENRYREIASNIPGVVYQLILKKEGAMSFPFISDGIREMIGLSPKEVQLDASKLFGLIVPEDIKAVNESIADSARTMRTWVKEFRVQTNSGEIKWFRATSNPHLREDGNVLWNGVILDITEQKRIEEELKVTQSQLIQAEKMDSIGRLAAGVAHEVKNPLAIILQGIDYLLPTSQSNDLQFSDILNNMNNAVERADSVIQGLLDFASLSEVTMTFENLNSILDESLLLVNHELDRAHIQAFKEYSTDIPEVKVHHNKVQQVFVNLFLNAVQAMPDGGELRIRTYSKKVARTSSVVNLKKESIFQPGDFVVVVEIQDSGTGIPKEIENKLFEPFFTTKRGRGGTGLGLSVVKSIMEIHRGSVELSNRNEAKGAKATVTFRARRKDDE